MTAGITEAPIGPFGKAGIGWVGAAASWRGSRAGTGADAGRPGAWAGLLAIGTARHCRVGCSGIAKAWLISAAFSISGIMPSIGAIRPITLPVAGAATQPAVA